MFEELVCVNGLTDFCGPDGHPLLSIDRLRCRAWNFFSFLLLFSMPQVTGRPATSPSDLRDGMAEGVIPFLVPQPFFRYGAANAATKVRKALYARLSFMSKENFRVRYKGDSSCHIGRRFLRRACETQKVRLNQKTSFHVFHGQLLVPSSCKE